MQIHPLITDSESLKSLCERLAQSDFVAVDTEFMRQSTYWPELCLLQLAGPTHEAVVDPLAHLVEEAPVFEHQAMRVEQRAVDFRQAIRDVCLQTLEILDRESEIV